MEYVGTAECPAPTLNRVNLSREEAERVFQTIVNDMQLWFACGRIHADLSAYNILYWQGEFRVIDFPQAVDPGVNSNAFPLLVRDAENICNHFRRYGIVADHRQLAWSIWKGHVSCPI